MIVIAERHKEIKPAKVGVGLFKIILQVRIIYTGYTIFVDVVAGADGEITFYAITNPLHGLADFILVFGAKTEITKYEDGQLLALAVIGIHDGTFSELAIGCDATGDEENEG